MSIKKYHNSLSIFNALRMFLRHQGLSQKIFAEKLSLPPSYISKIINNNCGLPKNFKTAFCDVFGFPIEDLLGMYEKKTDDSVKGGEGIYKIAKPSIYTSLSAKEFMIRNDRLNADITGLLPLLGYDNKRELLEYIYKTYIIPVDTKDGEGQEEKGDK